MLEISETQFHIHPPIEKEKVYRKADAASVYLEKWIMLVWWVVVVMVGHFPRRPVQTG